MVVSLDYKLMAVEGNKFVDNLIRASIFDIDKPEEANKLIDDGGFFTIDDIDTIISDATSIYHINAMTDALLRIQIVH